jgi:DNA modification methylase
MKEKGLELPFENSSSHETPKVSKDKIELFDGSISRGFYSTKNRLNNLTGREWVYWSKSVITKPYPPNFQHSLRSKHGGQKPPDLCADLIKTFTKEGQSILDPFMGVGGTLIGASIVKRKAVGIEIQKEWIDIYLQVCELEGIDKQAVFFGDSRTVLDTIKDEFDFVLTDVPYWNIDKLPKSTGKYKKVGETSRKPPTSKLTAFNGKMQSKDEWLEEMSVIFRKTYGKLKKNGYLAAFIGEMYRGGRYHFLPYELAVVLEKIGYTPKANLVWYDGSNKLHVYGYLYEYIPSLIHQNILIFRKE